MVRKKKKKQKQQKADTTEWQRSEVVTTEAVEDIEPQSWCLSGVVSVACVEQKTMRKIHETKSNMAMRGNGKSPYLK